MEYWTEFMHLYAMLNTARVCADENVGDLIIYFLVYARRRCQRKSLEEMVTSYRALIDFINVHAAFLCSPTSYAHYRVQ